MKSQHEASAGEELRRDGTQVCSANTYEEEQSALVEDALVHL